MESFNFIACIFLLSSALTLALGRVALFQFIEYNYYKLINNYVHAGQNEPSCFESGEIGGSNILDMMPAEDAQECLDNCKRRDDCDFFTYYDDTGDCYIFPYASEFLTDGCQDCVSGPATCEGSIIQ